LAVSSDAVIQAGDGHDVVIKREAPNHRCVGAPDIWR
jgi:hypothetical protein